MVTDDNLLTLPNFPEIYLLPTATADLNRGAWQRRCFGVGGNTRALDHFTGKLRHTDDMLTCFIAAQGHLYWTLARTFKQLQ